MSTHSIEKPQAAVNSFTIHTPTCLFLGTDQLTSFAIAAAKKTFSAPLLALLPFALGATAAFAGSGDISFEADTAYPESVSWSAKQESFFTSSVHHGLVGKVSKDGHFSVFIRDPKLVSAVGILADDARNTIWVANSDPGAGDRTQPSTQGKLAAVATYDSRTGKAKAYYDLGRLSEGAHFANDLALDAEGNAYVTDSFAPIIYRITSSGETSIFAKNDLFKKGDGFNLNGIAWHHDGYLLVGKYNTGEIYRVDIHDPSHVEQVAIPEALVGADGFNLADDQHLFVVQNKGADRTVELTSTDGWKTAQISRVVKSELSMPTAATKAGKDVFVLNARLDTLFNPDAPKVSTYLLQKL
jgi:sugar lactone lactonase YvrE